MLGGYKKLREIAGMSGKCRNFAAVTYKQRRIMEAKHLYIIGGPNGAGKTTASYSVLPKILECREFVNADEIARSNVIRRRYQEGIDNLFHIYMPIVDTWVLVNNSMTPRSIVATGGRNQQTEINDEVEFKNIEAYVKH